MGMVVNIVVYEVGAEDIKWDLILEVFRMETRAIHRQEVGASESSASSRFTCSLFSTFSTCRAFANCNKSKVNKSSRLHIEKWHKKATLRETPSAKLKFTFRYLVLLHGIWYNLNTFTFRNILVSKCAQITESVIKSHKCTQVAQVNTSKHKQKKRGKQKKKISSQ